MRAAHFFRPPGTRERARRERATPPAVNSGMTPRTFIRALFSVAVSLAMASACAAAPKWVKATYAGTMNGMAIGVITEVFEADGPAYRIVSETRPIGLATLLQRQPLRFASHGQVTREGLKPVHFEARRTASDAPQITADFDWTLGQLTLRQTGRTESHPLAAGTQDRLSIMYQ